MRRARWNAFHFAPLNDRASPVKMLCGFLLVGLLCGCTTWGYKSRIGTTVYPKTDWRTVEVFWSPPARAFEQVGIVSVLGGAGFITADSDMIQKLRKSAAEIGGNAVVVMREGESFAQMPSSGSTTAVAGSSIYGSSVAGASSSWYSGAAYTYPRNMGMAIRWK